MEPKELLKRKLSGYSVERLLFCPAIYEHKAKLLNKSISEVSQDGRLLEQSVFAEYETYRPDMLTVGIDIYNVEAEALGINIKYSESLDIVPEIQGRLLDDISRVDELKPVNIENTARIPQILRATENINEQLGSEVYVRGCISGPFSIAAAMLGIESLLMACVMKPEQAKALIDFCAEVSIAHATAYVKKGLPICLFNSLAAPPLLSPKLYKYLVLPGTIRIAKVARQFGCEFIEYVVGGETNEIASDMASSGFDMILSDFSSDVKFFTGLSVDKRVLIRRNINPSIIENGPKEELVEQTGDTIRTAKDNDNFIIGTGVLSYNTPTENILKIRKMCFLEGI